MINLTPFLLFDGNCAEAMVFYHYCLGGHLAVTKLGETPMKEQAPPRLYQRVVNAKLESNCIIFTATDWLHPTRKFKQGNTVAMYINDGKFEDLKAIFDKLSEGADKEYVDELLDMPFGSYGHLMDKFGVHWFFQGEKNCKK